METTTTETVGDNFYQGYLSNQDIPTWLSQPMIRGYFYGINVWR